MPSICYFLIIILCSIGITITSFYYNSIEATNDYAIVFDAGSSGTRMFIYEWDSMYQPEQGKRLLVNQVLNCNTDDNGIDKISNRGQLERMFAKCISEAHQAIPVTRWKRTKISLAATAGMRLLQKVSMKDTNKTLEAIRDFFNKTGFLYQDESQVQIISGRNEAINAWIAANYIENNFNWLQPAEAFSTKGVMDLGGASTQIIFVPEHPDPQFSTKVRIFGFNYFTYSESFLCYGLDQVNLIYKANLAKASKDAPNLPAQCFPANSTSYLTQSQKKKSPCINGMIYNDKISEKFHQMDNKILGNSNYEECVLDVRKILDVKQKCQIGTDYCSFHDVFISDVKSSKFMAVSGFWYNLKNTNKLLNASFGHNLTSFREATKLVCSYSWDQLIELNEENNARISKSRLINMCFANIYTMELLRHYGFESLDNIKIIRKVKGKKISWTLGYLINALNQKNYLPPDKPTRKLSETNYIILMFFLVPILILACIVFFYCLLKPCRYQNPDIEL